MADNMNPEDVNMALVSNTRHATQQQEQEILNKLREFMLEQPNLRIVRRRLQELVKSRDNLADTTACLYKTYTDAVERHEMAKAVGHRAMDIGSDEDIDAAKNNVRATRADRIRKKRLLENAQDDLNIAHEHLRVKALEYTDMYKQSLKELMYIQDIMNSIKGTTVKDVRASRANIKIGSVTIGGSYYEELSIPRDPHWPVKACLALQYTLRKLLFPNLVIIVPGHHPAAVSEPQSNPVHLIE